MASSPTSAPLALYVHWPYCRKKCPYCDFNSHVRDSIDHTAWAAHYIQGLDYWHARMDNPRPLSSIFFGGGTPSLMAPETVEAVIAHAQQRFGILNDCEITLEANPTSVEAERFRAVAMAGVNRLSLGVQALNNADLAFLGREHSADEALRALDLAQASFARVSFDLIYARPGQTPESWHHELARAIAFGTEHMSLYQLTIEPETEFGKRFAKGQLPTLPDEAQADLYDQTQAQMAAAGLPAYEISNHARPGQSSRHNLVYWQGGDWIGLGPGAHGRVDIGGTRRATVEVRTPESWQRQMQNAGTAVSEETALSAHETLTEKLMMGLRLSAGIPAAPFAAILDTGEVQAMQEAGFIANDDPATLRLTAQGLPVLNAVLARIIKDQ